MAFSPEYTDSLASDLAFLYTDAEDHLMRLIARRLLEGLDAPRWAEDKLLQLQVLQFQTSGFLEQMRGKTRDEIAIAILKAWNRGDALARLELDDYTQQRRTELDLVDVIQRNTGHPGLPPVESLVLELEHQVVATHGAILRSVADVYRNMIAFTSSKVLLGVQTRREAAASALKNFARDGISGFTDKAGRQWDMASYVEMATRSAVANAGVQGHADRLVANGYDLVYVSDAPQECKLCRPWEGKVLYLLGFERPPKGVEVAGSLDAAKAAGLFHPNCRHSMSLYIPGVTNPTPNGRTADPEGDKARRRLRYLERQVRRHKRFAEMAGDTFPDERARALATVRAYQAKIREHVATTTAKRQPHREQLGPR